MNRVIGEVQPPISRSTIRGCVDDCYSLSEIKAFVFVKPKIQFRHVNLTLNYRLSWATGRLF